MKFTNTKVVGKEIGKDVVVIGKTSLKLVGDILKMPGAVVSDFDVAVEAYKKERAKKMREAVAEELAEN